MLSFNWTSVIWSDEEVVQWTKSDWEEDLVTDNVLTRRSKNTLTICRDFGLHENSWDVSSDTSRKTTDGQEQWTTVIICKRHDGDVRMCIMVSHKFPLHRCWSVNVASHWLLIYPSWLSQSLWVQSPSKLYPSHGTPYICVIWTRELFHSYSCTFDV